MNKKCSALKVDFKNTLLPLFLLPLALILTSCQPVPMESIRDAGQETVRDEAQDIRRDDSDVVTIHPRVYERALRNPLKGFTGRDNEWATLQMEYIYWNDIENHESDGIEKIRRVLNERWEDYPDQHIKVIPRVILHWSGEERTYWPTDMETGDYTSEQFKQRVVRLIERLGKLWNEDPRVAFVEVGIVGKWGEHHSPNPTPEVQELISDAFRRALPDKLASVRHPWKSFEPGQFGWYWDSFGHQQQMYGQGSEMAEMFKAYPNYWRENYIGGEVAYNWGHWKIQPGETPAHSVKLPVHRDFLINTIRWLHATQLRWIDAYERFAVQQNFELEAVKAGAEIMQKTFGYRFLLEQVTFPARVQPGEPFEVELNVRNVGAAPFYYDWELELALLDPETLEPVWRAPFDGVDIRDWLPGSGWPAPEFVPYDSWPGFVAEWPEGELAYATPALSHPASGRFTPELPEGEYILSLAILDPGGQVPSVRFATKNYLEGGRHPVGIIAIGEGQGGALPETLRFDDPNADRTLRYLAPDR